MRYFMKIDDNPKSKTYNEPKALYRFEVSKKHIITEWWNPKTNEWEDKPEVLNFMGLGGADNYFEVGANKAMEFQKVSPRVDDE